MGKFFLENVRAAHPEGRYAIVVGSRGDMVKDLFAAYPWLEVVEANRRSPLSIWRLWSAFGGSDLTLIQYGHGFNAASKIVARLLTRRGGLVGFDDGDAINARLYDTVVPLTAGSTRAFEMRALSSLGIPLSVPQLRYAFLDTPTVLQKFGLREGKFVVVHLFPGATWRSLSPDNQQLLLQQLLEKLPEDIDIVLSGAKGDRARTEQLQSNPRIKTIAGRASLQELATIMSRGGGVVSLDTGVGHMASQVGVRAVIISTCKGLGWWSTEQYPEQLGSGQVIVFSRNDLCVGGHTFKDYGDCMNMVDLSAVAAQSAQNLTKFTI